MSGDNRVDRDDLEPDKLGPPGSSRWAAYLDWVRTDLAATGARTTAILRDFPLDATASPGGRFAADPPSLEWICFHVLAEYARHAGQLDVALEVRA